MRTKASEYQQRKNEQSHCYHPQASHLNDPISSKNPGESHTHPRYLYTLTVIPAKAGIHVGPCQELVLALHLHWIGMYSALM
jgi:hypothetical protein